jgi:hypothetical protein
MKLLSQDEQITKIETSVVELEDGRKVIVINYINEKGRVDDTRVEFDNGVDLESEGEEGQLSEDVQKFVEDCVEKKKKKAE